MKKFPELILISLMVFILISCVSPKVKQVTPRDTIDIRTGVDAKPLLFKKVVVKLPRGKEIGTLQIGLLCMPTGRPLTWKGGRVNITSDDFTEVFREELEKANYPIVGNPDALFEDPSEWKAELLVAGMIKDIRANICYPLGGFRNYSESKGEAFVEVEWQIYSRLDRNVVYTTTTEGSSEIKETSPTGALDIMLSAFAVATQNLLADQGFHDLVVRKDNDKTIKPVGNEINLPLIANFSTPLTDHINDVRAGVATIYAGEGHGSGFFINKNGYLITNEHVVREAKFVKVKLAIGREILGEVLKVNGQRDIALVKTEEIKMPALPIKNSELNIGSEVYAIGSPLDDELNTTLSRGIISAYRVEDNLRYIQSDINVLPGNSGGPLLDKNGNIIGVTVSGRIFHGAFAGINYFIPIRDALLALNIKTTNNKIISVSQRKNSVDLTDQLKTFLSSYCKTYESKDLDRFFAFFTPDATENNKDFHELLPAYRKNIEMIESFNYRIDIISYSLGANTGNIKVKGKYYAQFLLHGGTLKGNSGNITMELIENGDSYLVKRLNYDSQSMEKVGKQSQWSPWVKVKDE